MDGQNNTATEAKKKVFKHSLVIDKDAAITFMKAHGFIETTEPDVYSRDDERSAAQKGAGARNLTIVNVIELINDPKAYRVFVHRWSKRPAAPPKA